jgi:ABC-type sugar transport system permease subunit
MYSNAFEFLDLGYGSAISYLLAGMVFILSVAQIRLLKRRVEY